MIPLIDVADDCSKGKVEPTEIFDKFEKCCGINLSVDLGTQTEQTG